jgi:hypothetical protein
MGGSFMTNYAKQQMVRMQTHAKFPFLVKIIRYIDDENKEYFRYANAEENITYDNEVYMGSLFVLDPPNEEGSKIGDAQITISSVDQLWIEKIRTTHIPPKIIFIATIVYDDGIIIGIEKIRQYTFTLRNAQWTDTTISWTMSYDENMRIRVPCDRASSQKVPGLA